LLRRSEELTMENQRRNAAHAAHAVGALMESGFRVCITHGNGPQACGHGAVWGICACTFAHLERDRPGAHIQR
jgi:carbamate kinase